MISAGLTAADEPGSPVRRPSRFMPVTRTTQPDRRVGIGIVALFRYSGRRGFADGLGREPAPSARGVAAWGYRRAMVQIKLPDGSVKEFPEAVSPREVAAVDRQAAGGRGGCGDCRGARRRSRSADREWPRRADRSEDPHAQRPRGPGRAAAFHCPHHGAGHHAALSRA